MTVVDYPDDTLDTTYAYDVAPAACPVGSAPLGRLASITRDGAAVDYCYDRFGRTTRDGALTYTFDANGNVATMAYPGGVEATYAYDLADRPVSLSVTTPASGGPQPVASGGTYKPAGPLTGLTLGNGTTEDREFTPRYFPESITWTGANVRIWTYQTDAIGNPTSIEATATCAGDLAVADQTISTSQTIESCADLILGPDLTLSTTADVSFRAAGTVRILDGFSVANSGRMSVESGAVVAPPTDLRLFEYQDGPDFLTRGDGPWGERDWTYDRIGNRLTETRDRSGTPETDTYQYELGASGNTALLDEVLLSPTGTADYGWDAAGNLDTLIRGANHLDFTSDAASRLSAIDRGDGVDVHASADFLYDGRSFLRRATEPVAGATVEPLYDSSGLLHALVEKDAPAAPERRHTFFYLAGRPVAQLTQQDVVESWQYLTTDHLGTPLLAADATGGVTWRGGFEAFGHDFADGTPESALSAEIFLRFPGQWDSNLWADAALGTGGLTYNVHRWYEIGTGRYTSPDPLGLDGDVHPYLYALANPLSFIDPTGEKSRICCVDIPRLPSVHCFINIHQDGRDTTCGLHGSRFSDGEEEHVGRIRRDKPFDDVNDPTVNCGEWNEGCGVDDCVIRTAAAYPNPSQYNAVTGSNSNTFAGEIARTCGLQRPKGGWARGWDADRAKPRKGRRPIPSPCALP